MNFFKKFNKKEEKGITNSREAAKERLHLVLMQDRANVSADFLELMKQEIIDVIKKYIDVDETAIDVKLTNQENEDGTNGAPVLYANIPIIHVKNEAKKVENKEVKKDEVEVLAEVQNKKEQEEASSVKEEDKKQEEESGLDLEVKEEAKEEKAEEKEPEVKQEEVEHPEDAKREEKQEKKEELKSED